VPGRLERPYGCMSLWTEWEIDTTGELLSNRPSVNTAGEFLSGGPSAQSTRVAQTKECPPLAREEALWFAPDAPIWPKQDLVLFLGLCARINTILCAPTLCLGTPPHPVIAQTIAQYSVPPRPPVIAIYSTQYWQWQYRAKAEPRSGKGGRGVERARPVVLSFGLYEIMFHSKASVRGWFIWILPPPRPALPTPLQYVCTTIGQYTTHPRPLLCMLYTT